MERDPVKRKELEDAQARQLFFEGLATTLKWIEGWVMPIGDDYLAWFTKPGALGTEHEMTADQVAEAIRHLERVRKITLAVPASE